MSQIKSTSSVRIYLDPKNVKFLKKPKTIRSAFEQDTLIFRKNEDPSKFPEVSSKYFWSEEPEISLKLNQGFVSASARDEFEKSIRRNVFLDSYYPRILSSCDDCETSKSGFTVGSKTYTLHSCCSASDSASLKTGFKESNRNCVKYKLKKVVNTNLKKKEPKEFTEFKKKEIEKDNKKFKVVRSQSKELNEKNDIFSAVDCFAKLHTRIENLEELLQNMPENKAVYSKFNHEPTTIHKQNKQNGTPSVTLENVISSTLWRLGSPLLNEATSLQKFHENSENFDTEQEISIIKKKLRILEKKLKQKEAVIIIKRIFPDAPELSCKFEMAGDAFKDSNESPKKKTYWNGTLSRQRPVKFKKVFSFLRTEQKKINCCTNKKNLIGKTKDDAATEVKNDFFRKCRKLRRKCSSIFGITDNNFFSKNYTIETDSINKVAYEKSGKENKLHYCINTTPSKIGNKKKESSTKIIFLRKCPQERILHCKTRKIKKKGRKYRFSKHFYKSSAKIKLESDKSKTCTKSELLKSKYQKDDTSDLSDKLFSNEQINCQENWSCKNVKTNFLNKNVFHKKLSRLIPYDKNISSTNISAIADYRKIRCCAKGQETQVPIKPYNCPCSWDTGRFSVPYRIISDFRPTSEKYELLQSELVKAKCLFNNATEVPKERKCTMNFIKLLKKGRKIKIPVLFEELCRTEKQNQAIHKLSDISMKFVLVERDSKNCINPLTKLIKKLSKTKSSYRSEQYVFGVTKCCCDNQVSRNLSQNST